MKAELADGAVAGLGAAEHLGGAASEQANALMDKGRDLLDSAAELIRERPPSAFGVAFAAGWIISSSAAATSKPRHDRRSPRGHNCARSNRTGADAASPGVSQTCTVLARKAEATLRAGRATLRALRVLPLARTSRWPAPRQPAQRCAWRWR